MAIFETNEDILEAIDEEGRIRGVIEIGWEWFNELSIEEINDKYTSELVGEKYGWLLADISYRLVGCNTVKQTILIEIDANSDGLLSDDASDFADWYDKRSQE